MLFWTSGVFRLFVQISTVVTCCIKLYRHHRGDSKKDGSSCQRCTLTLKMETSGDMQAQCITHCMWWHTVTKMFRWSNTFIAVDCCPTFTVTFMSIVDSNYWRGMQVAAGCSAQLWTTTLFGGRLESVNTVNIVVYLSCNLTKTNRNNFVWRLTRIWQYSKHCCISQLQLD